MAYRNGTTHVDPPDALHIKFSDDYGETWTAEDTDLNGDAVSGLPISWDGGYGVVEPKLYLCPSGRIILHLWKHIWSSSALGAHQSVSDDGGLTWSAPAAITFVGYSGGNIIYTADDYFVDDTGRLYAGGREATDASETQIRNIIVYTDDEGVTWNFLSNVSALSPGTSEIGIEWVGGDNVTALLRAKSNNHTYRSASTDRCATWSTPVEISNVIPFSGRHRIYTRDHLLGIANWQNDDHWLACGFVFLPGSTRRAALWTTSDRGVNWSDPLYVDVAYGDGGYGEVFYNPNSSEYVFLCYGGTTSKADLIQYNCSIAWQS